MNRITYTGRVSVGLRAAGWWRPPAPRRPHHQGRSRRSERSTCHHPLQPNCRCLKQEQSRLEKDIRVYSIFD